MKIITELVELKLTSISRRFLKILVGTASYAGIHVLVEMHNHHWVGSVVRILFWCLKITYTYKSPKKQNVQYMYHFFVCTVDQ